jgi:hypothetical protein
MKDVPFKRVPTSTTRFAEDPDYPLVMEDAFQVYECAMDGKFEYRPFREGAAVGQIVANQADALVQTCDRRLG